MKALTFDNSVDRAARLNHQHFGQMLALAFLFHLIVALVWSLLPHQETLQVPVHVINIKLGSAEEIANPSLLPPQVADTSKAEAASAKTSLPEPVSHTLENALAPATGESVKKPAKTKQASAKQSEEERGHTSSVKVEKASRSKNVQYVREGSVYGNSKDPKAEILSRYEQQISSWIQKFKITPKEARGLEGEAVVRLRINRQGQILYAALERGTGHDVLDKAVSDMIKNANPVPAVPRDYPPGELLEFLVPISFRVE